MAYTHWKDKADALATLLKADSVLYTGGSALAKYIGLEDDSNEAPGEGSIPYVVIRRGTASPKTRLTANVAEYWSELVLECAVYNNTSGTNQVSALDALAELEYAVTRVINTQRWTPTTLTLRGPASPQRAPQGSNEGALLKSTITAECLIIETE